MKNIISLLLILIFFSACKTKSTIITSKDEAIKKNKYENIDNRTIPIEKQNKPEKAIVKTKKAEQKKEPQKSIKTDTPEADFALNPKYDSYLSEQLVNNALENIGSKYRTGGTTKDGFDCSGLMYATFALFDIKLPRTSNEQSTIGVKINPKDAKKGDLIFFKTRGRGQINHVGMVVEINDDEIKFVHSSIQRGVIISSTKEPYYKNDFVQINRILE